MTTQRLRISHPLPYGTTQRPRTTVNSNPQLNGTTQTPHAAAPLLGLSIGCVLACFAWRSYGLSQRTFILRVRIDGFESVIRFAPPEDISLGRVHSHAGQRVGSTNIALFLRRDGNSFSRPLGTSLALRELLSNAPSRSLSIFVLRRDICGASSASTVCPHCFASTAFQCSCKQSLVAP